MLRRQDVGRRVVVRTNTGTGADRPRYTDLLGLLVELTGTDLTVLTRHGPRQVPLARVHRAKLVPPAPAAAAGSRAGATTGSRTGAGAGAMADPAEVHRLEAAANESWPAPVQQRLGDWLLRAADGWTGRANTALPLGDPGRPLADAVDAVTDWYAARALPAQFNVPLPAAADVAAVLADRGWQARPLVLVQTADLADLRTRADAMNAGPDAMNDGATAAGATAARADLPPVRLAYEPDADWLSVVAARKSAGESLPAAAHQLLTGAPHVRFAQIHDAGTLIAVARATVSADRHWCGVSLLEVAPAARRRGLARHLLGTIAGWAHDDMGARRAFLQVEQRNPATALYTRLGFTTHHVYVPWGQVSDAPPGGAC
ncbi:GNAT family N-acetyltransferase [Solwaraspora sp. WMMA2056]|uniref:GNAT family N-acetyltransferase n=1 Tax=Solwaraspora sp. WMMA2056 TaxID=3015161 RepID=UPI00259B99AF|nr:GNAT family N-acetyltransferase [Solwaraspora sp. WMMA2056]WJK40532.1 GNAT family N-acetyltransferase [Solwaraspora sp. WMMA2056]